MPEDIIHDILEYLDIIHNLLSLRLVSRKMLAMITNMKYIAYCSLCHINLFPLAIIDNVVLHTHYIPNNISILRANNRFRSFSGDFHAISDTTLNLMTLPLIYERPFIFYCDYPADKLCCSSYVDNILHITIYKCTRETISILQLLNKPLHINTTSEIFSQFLYSTNDLDAICNSKTLILTLDNVLIEAPLMPHLETLRNRILHEYPHSSLSPPILFTSQ